jgi:hypothetical protein
MKKDFLEKYGWWGTCENEDQKYLFEMLRVILLQYDLFAKTRSEF